MVQTLWKTGWLFLKRLNIHSQHNCSNSTSTHLFKWNEIKILTMALYIRGKYWKQFQWSFINLWIKQNVVYSCNGMLCSAIKRGQLLIHAKAWVNLKNVLNERSQCKIVWFQSREISRNDTSIQTESRSAAVCIWGQEQARTTNEPEGTSDNGTALTLDHHDGYTTL